jgi:hypothetical protein
LLVTAISVAFVAMIRAFLLTILLAEVRSRLPGHRRSFLRDRRRVCRELLE